MVEGYMDFNIFLKCVFDSKCDKGKENNLYQIYIELCYSYVLVILFTYKVRILFILCVFYKIK